MIGYFHDYDEPKGGVEGVDYSVDIFDCSNNELWPVVQECMAEHGLLGKTYGVDYLIDTDYDEF